METGQEPLYEKMYGFLKKKLPRYYRLVFAVSFALAMVVHLYMFTNKLINHDDVDGLYSDCAFGLSSGRWLLQAVTGLTGNFSSSWLNGLMGSAMLALSCTLVVKILDIRQTLPAILISLCMIAFPTVASTYAYMFCSSQYLIAMALALAGAALIRRGGLSGSIIGACLIAMSMGCYQSYFCLAAAILVLAMLLDTLRRRWQGKLRPFILTGVRYVACLAAGMVLYYVILKLLLWYTGTELTTYQGIADMGNITPAILLRRLRAAYSNLITYYNNGYLIYHGVFPLLVKISFVFDAFAVVFIIFSRKLYRRPMDMLMLAALIVILPLACNLIYIMTDAGNVHQVMVYPAVVPLLLPVVLGSELSLPEPGSLRKVGTVLACALLVIQAAFSYEFVLITNRAYFSMDIAYENAYAYMTKLTAKIELQPGYTSDTPVLFVGTAYTGSPLPPTYMTGVLTVDEMLNMYSRLDFLRYYLATSYPTASQEEIDNVMESEEYAAMPCYPDEGSVAMIDGVAVVKLSEIEN